MVLVLRIWSCLHHWDYSQTFYFIFFFSSCYFLLEYKDLDSNFGSV